MRKSYVSVNGEWVPKDEYYANLPEPGVMIMPDIQPYRSMCDGSMITSRSKHREHLKVHGVVEVGNAFDNAKRKEMRPPPGLKDRIAQIAHEKLRR